MNRNQGQLTRGIPNMSAQNSQSRSTGPSSRVIASKLGAWNTAGSVGSQIRESSGPGDTWTQTMNPRPNTQLDLSSQSFPSLAGGTGNQLNSGSTSTPWGTGPSTQETRRQPQSRGAQSRQQTRDNFFSGDAFSRGGPTRIDDMASSEQTRSNAPNERFPPGLVPRHRNPLSETVSSDPSRVTSPAGPPGLAAKSPLAQSTNDSGQDRGQNQQSPLSNTLAKDPFTNHIPSGSSANGDTQSAELLLDSMSPRDRWGLAGWSALHDGPDVEHRALLRGQDLQTLGLSAQPGQPLLRSYPGPFAPPNAFPPRPLDTDFTIPDCYIVQNVAPINTRISGFTEDTLFYIFYTSPKDIIQEEVATELMSRKWRFHMKEKMWLTRDDTTAAPVILEKDVSEQGYYIWWDWRNWTRARRAYTLRYEDLDDHLSGIGTRLANSGMTPAQGPLSMNGGTAPVTQGPSMSGFNAVPGLERMAALGMGRGF